MKYLKSFAFPVLAFVLMFALIPGCEPKNENILIESFRLPVYKQGDMLIYKSGNNYDTFVYTKQEIYYTYAGENYRTQDIFYGLQNKKDTSIYSGIGLQFNITAISWQNKLMIMMADVRKPDTTSMILNGQEYRDVYYNKKPLSDTAEKFPAQIYFTYKNWIIRYVMNDSTTWDLVQH